MLDEDDRCGAVHPTLGIRCDRMAKDCYIDHTATLKDGRGEFWPNPDGRTPMHEYFRLLISGIRAMAPKPTLEYIQSTNEKNDLEE
jgi:hypothetical protein